MSTRRFYTEHRLEEGKIIDLSENESKHASQALRLEVGDEVVVFNEEGEYDSRIADMQGNIVSIAVIKQREIYNTKDWKLTVFLGVIKLPQFEIALQKLSELGVDTIVPMYTEYSQIKLENLEHKRERWKNILISAAKQSERKSITEVLDPITFKSSGDVWINYDISLFCTVPREMYRQHLEIQHISKAADEIKGAREVSLIIGPEGGFSIAEHQLAIDWHLKVVHLGQDVLRAETASIAAAATINYIKYSN